MTAARQFGKFLGGGFVRVLFSVKFSAEAGVKGVGKASANVDVKEALTGIIEEYGKHVKPQEAYYNVFEKALEDWITRCYKGNKRLVIFIEDLDRCLPKIALQVLEAIKLYLNIPNLVVIVGVDRQVIDAVVMKHYENSLGGKVADEIGTKARQYLDKMFQVEAPIAPNNLQVKEYIAARVKETALWNNLAEEHRIMFEGIIGEFADINPRSVVRALNTAIVGAESETDELAHLQGGLAGLQTLWLNDTKVTDAGLAHLQGLAGLQELRLERTQVTDAGLAHLAGLTELLNLLLAETQVTDAGLAHLRGLTVCETCTSVARRRRTRGCCVWRG